MASLYKNAKKSVGDAVIQVATATTIYRQQRSPNFDETCKACEKIKNIDLSDFKTMPESIQKITSEIIAYCMSNNNWDKHHLTRLLMQWMDEWLEKVGYIDTFWGEVVDWMNHRIELEYVPELEHLDDFTGYKNLIEIDEDVHFAIRGLFQEKKTSNSKCA